MSTKQRTAVPDSTAKIPDEYESSSYGSKVKAKCNKNLNTFMWQHDTYSYQVISLSDE